MCLASHTMGENMTFTCLMKYFNKNKRKENGEQKVNSLIINQKKKKKKEKERFEILSVNKKKFGKKEEKSFLWKK